MCARRSWMYVFAFLSLGLFLAPATSWAQSAEAQPETISSTNIEPSLVETSQLLIDCLQRLEAMLIQQQIEQSQARLDSQNIELSLNAVIENDEKNSGELLEQSDILALLLAESVTAATISSNSLDDVSNIAEQLTADLSGLEKEVNHLELRRSIWRAAACVGAGATIGALADDAQGALYGAGAGMVSIGVYELGHRILRWW